MKLSKLLVPVFLVSFVALTGCGYHNPNVYSGPEKSIYITNWKNRTNVLSLDINIYQSLVKWFQKSGSITITKGRTGADAILAGEIVSIEQPSLSYGENQEATEVKLKLKIRYIMKDLKTGKVILEKSGETWTEEYLVGSSSTETKDNENEALEEIIDDLSQQIYRAAIKQLPKQ